MSGLSFDLRWTAPDAGFRLDCAAQLPATGTTAVFGHSGSGKTSLLYCIAGLRPADSGSVIQFANNAWQSEDSVEPVWRRSVGVVFQEARLFPHLNVAGNLDYASRRARPNGPDRGEIVSALGIESLLHRPPDTLSAGQKQRVAIARALLGNPRLLLLDEPLANLDMAARRECLECLVRLRSSLAIPMIYVSHAIEEIYQLADHVLLLRDGSIVDQGQLLDMAGRLDSPLSDEPRAAAIVETRVLAHESEHGLSRLDLNGQSIWVTQIDVEPETTRRLRIPARDVSICRTAPTDSSILNILCTRLLGLRDDGEAHCMLQLEIGGQHLLARITRKSADALALTPGDTLFAQIKSTALTGESL